MFKDKLTAHQREIVENNNGMTRYLSALEEGRPATPRSWLYEDKAPEGILKNGFSVLEQKLRDSIPEEENVFHFELRAIPKGGPQGKVPPIKELLEDVMETFQAGSPLAATRMKEWEMAKAYVISKIVESTGYKRLRPASFSRVVDDMRARDTLESNSGGPLFTRRNKPEVIEASINDAQSGKWKEYPAIILFRNYGQKTRSVGMYPMATNIVEGSFLQPLFQSLVGAKHPFLAPGEGFSQVRELITHTYNSGYFISASDFRETDEHFTKFATKEVFEVIKHAFQERYGSFLEESLLNVNSIPLIVGKNEIIYGDHGCSSGSNGTNFIETIFDGIFTQFVYFMTGKRYKGLYAIGDDISGLNQHYSSRFSGELAYLGKLVGQVINSNKVTNEPNSVISLQRLFQRGYSRPQSNLIRGVYPTIRALNSIVYPEKFHNPKLWSSDMFCARIYMILENCVDHPLFEDFVKFVVKGNKHLIPFAKLAKEKLDRITRETKLLPGFNPTYNQENRDTSLASFRSISIASTL